MVISAIQKPRLKSSRPSTFSLPPMWARNNPLPASAFGNPCLIYSSLELEGTGCDFLLLETGSRIDLE
jgi:hypothetical protein